MSRPVSADFGQTRTPAVLGGVPAFDEPVTVTRALAPDRRAFDQRVDTIFDSRWFTNHGPLVQELEESLAQNLEAGFCAAFCNGTAALQSALRSLDLEGEVVTTPFTFPATVHAIEWSGLTPVFCDVDPGTWNLDPAHAAERVGERTSAILPVHVFGNPCDVGALDVLASSRSLRTVYDAAHAFGVRHRGRSIVGFGDLSVISFHATKIFHTAEGGAVLGRDPRRYERLALLRNFGIAGEEEVRGLGVNGKLSELHAALGLSLLAAEAAERRAREGLFELYREALSRFDGIGFQQLAPDTERNHYNLAIEIYPGRFGLSRDELHRALRAENVITRKYFKPLCSENPAYRELPSADPADLPHAHSLAERVLCLPFYGDLGPEGVERVVAAIAGIHGNQGPVRRALA